MKFFSFDPSARKRKTNSKPKPKKSNITEHKLYDDDSHGYDGEWANIDDFSSSLSDSNALRSLDPGLLAIIGATGLSGSLYPGISNPSTVQAHRSRLTCVQMVKANLEILLLRKYHRASSLARKGLARLQTLSRWT
jgi:hypothetical protein